MAMVNVDQSAAGSTVQLAMGDQAQLTLPETRTAGYSWNVVSAESPVFALEDAGFTRAPGVGGTGTHRWTIAAMRTGSAELELAYGRSWETEAGKKFAMTIMVK
jgi:predicted secreted protein